MDSVFYDYDAFISYRHLPLDMEVARRLQILLESYHPPRDTVFLRTNRIKRIFRDQSELPLSGDLNADIKKALQKSQFLIVVCSEETKHSIWCMREIEYFKSLRGGKCSNILTVLISGNPKEAFPNILCHEIQEIKLQNGETILSDVEIEPFAANITADTKRKTMRLLSIEYLRIASPLLGCAFDDLYKRHHRRNIKRVIQFATVFLTIIISFSFYILHNQQQLAEKVRIADEQRVRAESEHMVRTLNIIEDIINSGDKVLASTLICELLENLPNLSEYIKSEIERLLNQSTYVPMYTQYAVLHHNEEITCAIFKDDEVFLAATKRGTVTAWSVYNGMTLGQFEVFEQVVAMLCEQDLLYVITKEKTLIVWNTVTWEKEYAFSFAQSEKDKFYSDISDIMLYGDTLYLNQGSGYTHVIIAVDLRKREAFSLNQRNRSFRVSYFDKERGFIIAVEQADDKILVLDLHTNKMQQLTLDMIFSHARYNYEKGELILFTQVGSKNPIFNIILYPINGGQLKSIEINTSAPGLFYNTNLGIFEAAEVSPNGRYLSMGDYYGNILIIDMEDVSYQSSYAAEYHKIYRIAYVDNECLSVSFSEALSKSGLYSYGSGSNIFIDIPNSFSEDIFVINKGRTVMAIIGTDGFVRLFNLRDATIEKYVSVMKDKIYGTEIGESDIDYLDALDAVKNRMDTTVERYWETMAVTNDEKYVLVHLLTAEQPLYSEYKYETNMGEVWYYSYWIADCITGEVLYNVNIPMDFIAIDLKNDTIATLLTASYFIYDIDLRTGEIICSVKLESSFRSVFSSGYTKFRVNYEMDKILLAVSFESFENGDRSRGMICSKASGKMLFEFSNVFGTKFLGFNRSATHIYKYDAENLDIASRMIDIEIPSYFQLVELARQQVNGRIISDSERIQLGF